MLLLISYFGSSLVRRLKIYADERGIFRKVLGLILAIVGLLIITGIDKKIETAAIEVFDITSIEQGILDRFLPSESPTSPEISIIKATNTGANNSNIPNLNIANPTLAPEIPASLTNWINSNPLTMAKLKGKVVIIDFWTYSCINCQRTLPYLTAWDAKYRDQ